MCIRDRPYTDGASVWLPSEPVPMSGFNETSAQTIVENGYEHPDVQMLKLADGSVFMAFLDSDRTRGSLDPVSYTHLSPPSDLRILSSSLCFGRNVRNMKQDGKSRRFSPARSLCLTSAFAIARTPPM